MLRFMREMRRVSETLVDELLADFWRACQGADAVIFSVVGAASWQVAERLGVPRAGAFLQPLTPTREFPAIGLPPALRLGGAFNRATHAVAEQLKRLPAYSSFGGGGAAECKSNFACSTDSAMPR